MKQLALAILCMTLITAVEAQDFNFGVTAGPNLSTARITEGDGEYIDDIKQPAYVIGFYIGGFAELGLTDKFSLRPELLYTQLGYRYAAEEGVNGFRLKSGYITLPVFAEYSITEKLKAGLGLYFSAKLTAKAKSISSSDDDLEEYP
ncbi:MAG TPA: porin family protein, partial [Niabella sp.]|nr:porin family protein [Niabella sp.]